jgi:hypothetical protein
VHAQQQAAANAQQQKQFEETLAFNKANAGNGIAMAKIRVHPCMAPWSL